MRDIDFDYRYIEGDRTHVQTVLNQWRHCYSLNIEASNISKDDTTILLVKRTKFKLTSEKEE